MRSTSPPKSCAKAIVMGPQNRRHDGGEHCELQRDPHAAAQEGKAGDEQVHRFCSLHDPQAPLDQAHQAGENARNDHVEQRERQEDLVDGGPSGPPADAPRIVRSATDRVATRDVSLMMTTPWLASDGTTFAMPAGRPMYPESLSWRQPNRQARTRSAAATPTGYQPGRSRRCKRRSCSVSAISPATKPVRR